MTSSVDAGLAAVVQRFGPPEVIQIELVGTPPPGSGQVRLRVQAAGVGSWDAQVRSGKGPTALSLPLVLGGDLAGVVESVGPGVAAVGVGDVVFGVTNTQLTGACAELALADAAKRVLVARRARLVTRVALLWCALREAFQERYEAVIGEGEELLVHVAPQLAAIV